MQPRGLRNNNPLNIRRTATQWLELAPTQTDPEFCQFQTLEYGWRAAFRLLSNTYYAKYGLDTIRKIIGRWAPPIENNTAAYVAAVSQITGIPPDDPLGSPKDHPARWLMLGAGMALHENGPHTIDYMAMLWGWEKSTYGTSANKSP